MYRSRTTPQRAANLAFSTHAPLEIAASRQVRNLDEDQLAELVVLHGFHVEDLLL